jgi:thiosulfate/3-mercaptopyruvate sulfurtransferase
MMLILIAWFSVAAAEVKQVQGTTGPQLLVSTDWLAANLSDSKLVVLHVGEESQYQDEHIAGARFVEMSGVLQRESESGLRNELPAPEELIEVFADLGISDDSRIIVYCADDWVNSTMRVLFTLDYVGLGAQASLLNGGMQLWKEEGRPLVETVPPGTRGTITPRESRDIVVGAEWVAAHRRIPGYALVDARPPDLYTGEQAHRGVRKGHIPGAHTLPFSRLFDDLGRFRSETELQLLFEEAGISRGDSVVAYCYTGMQATSVLFAARLLGNDVMLYDGSYEEWGIDAELPVHAHNN